MSSDSDEQPTERWRPLLEVENWLVDIGQTSPGTQIEAELAEGLGLLADLATRVLAEVERSQYTLSTNALRTGTETFVKLVDRHIEALNRIQAGLPDTVPTGEPVEYPLSVNEVKTLATMGWPPPVIDAAILQVSCPSCRSRVGDHCLTGSGWYASEPHAARCQRAADRR